MKIGFEPIRDLDNQPIRELTGFDEMIFATEAKSRPVASMINLVARLKEELDAGASEKSLSMVRQLSLDQWEKALLTLRKRLIGDVVTAECHCGECLEGVSLVFQISELPMVLASDPLAAVMLSKNERVSFRPMTIGDLEILEAVCPDDETDRCALLLDQVTGHSSGWGKSLLVSKNKEKLLNALDLTARDLDLRLGANCAACGAALEARFDVTAFVTSEITRHAEHLLDDVHKIALAYHWAEDDIFSLGVSRRAAYLRRIEASAAITAIG